MEYRLINDNIQSKQLNAIERVLINRGIGLNDISHYLNTDNDDIASPLLLDNMDKGAKLLFKHIINNNKAFIQVDSDADGYTSSSVLFNYLFDIFPYWTTHNLSYRLHEGKQHGIILDTIPTDVKLVIIPDAGSNQKEEFKILKEKGIEVLVLDHHEVDDVPEDACIINNQICDYPSKFLSGVGIVWKFCSYIDSLLNYHYAEDYIDMTALGIISDMMDLKDFEVKRIIDLGLNNIKNPFMSTMVDAQSYSIGRHGGLDPYSVSFYITPQINATIRVGTEEEKKLLFKSMLKFEAYKLVPSTKRGCKGQTETIVEQVCRNCNNIKNRQQKMRDESLELINNFIEEENLTKHKILTIPLTNPVDSRITGLIANQLMSKFQQPVLLLNKTVNENGEIIWAGSGRNCANSPISNLRELVSYSQYPILAQGHASAFGFSISDKVIKDFVTYMDTTLSQITFEPIYLVDFIYNGQNFKSEDILQLATYKSLWGQGMEEPYIAISGLRVNSNNITLLSPDKNPTLKIVLNNGTSIMKFKSSQEEYNSLVKAGKNVIIELVGKCNLNEWNGNITPQIIIENYDITGEEFNF